MISNTSSRISLTSSKTTVSPIISSRSHTIYFSITAALSCNLSQCLPGPLHPASAPHNIWRDSQGPKNLYFTYILLNTPRTCPRTTSYLLFFFQSYLGCNKTCVVVESCSQQVAPNHYKPNLESLQLPVCFQLPALVNNTAVRVTPLASTTDSLFLFPVLLKQN